MTYGKIICWRPPWELALPPRGNPGSATVICTKLITTVFCNTSKYVQSCASSFSLKLSSPETGNVILESVCTRLYLDMNFTVKSVQNGCRLGSLVNKTQGIVVETPTCMLYTKSGRCPVLGGKISGLFSLQ